MAGDNGAGGRNSPLPVQATQFKVYRKKADSDEYEPKGEDLDVHPWKLAVSLGGSGMDV